MNARARARLALLPLLVVLGLLPAPPLTGKPAAPPRGPERLDDQGIQGADEIEAANRAVRAWLSKPDVDEDGLRDIEMVFLSRGTQYWVIGDLDLTTRCRPTLFVESTFRGCDAIRFTRYAAPGARERYNVTPVAGRNPLGTQGPRAHTAIATIPEEFRRARTTIDYDGKEGCTLAEDPNCRPLDIRGIFYPYAYERISALFDSPRAPDLVALQPPGGPDSSRSGHYHLSVVHSRSTLLVAGRGARRSPLPAWEEARLRIKHVDIAPTIASAIGVTPHGQGRRLNGTVDPNALLLRQDGRVLDGLLEPTFNTFVIVMDGMEPDLITPTLTPNIWALIRGETGNATVYTKARGSMVAETTSNHMTMMTGLPGRFHGIVANGFYDRSDGALEPMAQSSLVLTDTLFDAIEGRKPWLRTAIVSGKGKLRDMFDCTRTPEGGCGTSTDNPEGVEVRHVRPDFNWGARSITDPAPILQNPDQEQPAEPVTETRHSHDRFTMDRVITLHRSEDPDFTLVNLSLIDGFSHLFGARSAGTLEAVVGADAEIGRLIDSLKEAGKWEHSILIITADHSFAELNGEGDAYGTDQVRVSNPLVGHVTGSRVILDEEFTQPGIEFMETDDGGAALIYLEDPSDRRLAARIAAHARRLRDGIGRKSVAGAFCRLPSRGCPPIPPRWGLDSPRVGEVLLVADDHHMFLRERADPGGILSGKHGQPTTLPVPLIVASGGTYVRQGSLSRPVTTRDIAPTVSWIYGIDGRGGRPFPGVERWSRPLLDAFSKHPLEAHRDGDIAEPIAKRALLITFDANNSADVHCLLSQYDEVRAIRRFCGETSEAFHPSLYPVPTLRWLRDQGTLTRYGSMASFPSVTFPNHNVLGGGVHPAHHGVPGNRFYIREQKRFEAPIDPTDLQNPAFFWSESLYGRGFETLHEAVHRTYGDWQGPINVDPTRTGGAFTAAVNEPTVRGADFASLEQPERSGEALFAAHWGRPDELAADTTQECFEEEPEEWGAESAIDHLGQGQARSLFEDPDHPDPTFTYLNLLLVDGAAHIFGPHTKCALAAYRDSASRLGRVLQTMRDEGVLGETLIVLTGDHGQQNQRQIVEEGQVVPFGAPFERALAGRGVKFVRADSFFYFLTMRVRAEPDFIEAGRNEITFTATDDDTGEGIGGASVRVSDWITGEVLAEGTTPGSSGGARSQEIRLPRTISKRVNQIQDLVGGDRPLGDAPTYENPFHQPSNGQVTLEFEPRGPVMVTVTHPDFSKWTFVLFPPPIAALRPGRI